MTQTRIGGHSQRIYAVSVSKEMESSVLPISELIATNGRLPKQMTIIEKILELKQSNQPFWIHLDNGREVEVRGGDWISVNPSGDNSHVTVYGPEDDEESWIPLCFNYQSLGQRNRTVTDSGIQISVARVT